ncbi:hypothetical protein [Halogeometricum borinquense]|nr:hypothetical protein [Halogeometricum borinquense]
MIDLAPDQIIVLIIFGFGIIFGTLAYAVKDVDEDQDEGLLFG